MCIVLDASNVVVSVSLIPGVDQIPSGYKVIFPWVGSRIPFEGDIVSKEELERQVYEIS